MASKKKPSRARAKAANARPASALDPAGLIAGGARLSIAAQKEGFRRGGARFSVKPAEVFADAFTEEQLALICEEPMLTVEVLPSGPKGAKEKEPLKDPPKEPPKE